MSIYIVQGPRILGCWERGRHRTPGKAHPAGPLSLCASALPARPTGPTSGFHFLLQRENEARK